MLYLLATGTAANFTGAVDSAGFTTAMTGTGVVTGVLLGATTVAVGWALRTTPAERRTTPAEQPAEQME